MEKYINKKTIVKDTVYEVLKDSITCPICECLMIEPMECSKCQNTYCKKCIESWKKKNDSCPNRCNSEFNKVIEKKNYITKMKFRCTKGCGAEIEYKDLESHYKANCISNFKKMVKFKKEEIPDKEQKDMKYFKSNFKILIIFIYSHNFGY